MNSKTFCVAPWIHTSVTPTGHLTPCCIWKEKPTHLYKDFDDWINTEEMRDLRKKLHNGEPVDSCRHCYAQEKYGRLSQRQVYNVEFSKFINLRKLNTTDWTVSADDVCTLDLKLGNLCNLKCVMCGGNASSQIMTEYVQHKEKFGKIKNYWVPDTELDFAWPLSEEFKSFLSKFQQNLKWIKFTGGEPTLIPYVFDFLSAVNNPQDITVCLYTNATTYNDKLFETLKKFKTVWLTASLEGIGQHNDLIRYKSEWTAVEENILTYQKLDNVRFVINHVLQSFSITTFIPLLEWCEQHQLKLIFTLLLGPVFLSLNSVDPDKIKQFQTELENRRNHIKFNSDVIPGVLKVLEDHRFDPALQKERLEYLGTLDAVRNTTLIETFEQKN